MTEEVALRKELGRITDTFLGIEDHGIFAFALTFDYGTSGQAFGPISRPNEKTITGILEALNVDCWEHIKGKSAYALIAENNLIVGIEGLPFDNGKRFVIQPSGIVVKKSK